MEGIDVTLLRIMRYREKLDNMYSALPMGALDEKTKILLDDFKQYFKEFETHIEIDEGRSILGSLPSDIQRYRVSQRSSLNACLHESKSL